MSHICSTVSTVLHHQNNILNRRRKEAAVSGEAASNEGKYLCRKMSNSDNFIP